MAVSEMKDMCGIQPGETPANQLRKRRIERDNNDIDKLVDILNETCNPFAIESPAMLVNIATGKSANLATSTYLLETLQRGAKLRREFYEECVANDRRLLKTVKRVKVKNFAAANMKVKSSKEKKALGAAEGVRDAFGYLLSKTDIDLNYVLAFPITELPLSLAHTDGTPTKTNKAALTKILESKQTSQQNDVPALVNATFFDGGLVLHEVLPRHNASTYGKIVADIMIKVCSASGDQVHLLLDKYVTPSIKDNERLKRGAEQDSVHQFVITGAEQQQKKKGIELLKDGSFKEALAMFLLTEIKKDHYAPIVGRKTVYISHGGKCLKLKVNSLGMLETKEPPEFQGTHEGADTLLAFHVYLTGGNVIVRSSDTDVLVILIGLVTKMTESSNIWLDFGSANTRRFINVTDISKELEKKEIGLSEALIGFHALTGCDFTSAFYRKGKSIPFTYLENAPNHVTALRSLCSDTIHKSTVTAYICRIYRFKALDNINEARYQSFTKMTRGKKNVQVKKINCSSLPPCENTLTQHLLRVNYVSMMWRRAHTQEPTKNLHPLDFGWIDNGEGKYVPKWFVGKPLPDTLIDNEASKSADIHTDEPSTISDTELLDVDSDAELLDDVNIDYGGSENEESEITYFDTEIDYDDHPWTNDSDSECEDDD